MKKKRKNKVMEEKGHVEVEKENDKEKLKKTPKKY